MPVKVQDGVLMSTSIGTAYYDISPDGDLAYAVGPPERSRRTLYWVDRQGHATPLALPARPYLKPRISPDGKRLAIEIEGPHHDFYLYDFEREVMSRVTNAGVDARWPGPGPKIQISFDGGTDPVWRRDGKEIFYRNGSKMMGVPVNTEDTFRAGKPELLWTADYMHGLSSSCGFKGTTTTSYDVSPDGQRLLMLKDTDGNMFATRIVVVVDWLGRRTTTAQR